MIYRIFVEKKDNVQARKEAADVKTLLNIDTEDFRLILRYDVEGITEEELNAEQLEILPAETEAEIPSKNTEKIAQNDKSESFSDEDMEPSAEDDIIEDPQ